MIVHDFFLIVLYVTVLLLLAYPLGLYMARVYEGKIPVALRWLVFLERGIYLSAGVRWREEMTWKAYAYAVLLFNALGLFAVYAMQRWQALLPLNPMAVAGVAPDSAFNTAVSFATNTNWQGYAGEATMSYLTQMAGLGVQNFVSAATGMAVLIPLIRGFARKESATVGNFWVDLTRGVVYILLPLAVVLAIFLVSEGVVQTLRPYAVATLAWPLAGPDGTTVTTQTLALGPAASQIAIKQLGTNGGGFFNTNSAHPFENPTGLTNFGEMIAILLIPAALCFTAGAMLRERRQGIALLAAMLVLFVPPLVLGVSSERAGNPFFAKIGVDQSTGENQGGGNMEGKEVRFGIAGSAIWAAATTAASNGSVNSMHDSYTPLGGLAQLVLMQMGEVSFGGVGSGLYGLLIFAVIAVFIAGLMVGRTPEYLGKKIEAFEMKMAAIGVLVPGALALIGTAVAVATEAGANACLNPGPHGLSEILYAFTSAANNNGSAFAGLNSNTPFYNTTLGIAMFLARFWIVVAVLAMAGSLAAKRKVQVSSGTLPTHTPLFVGFLVGTVLLAGALTFLPALALGPIVEQLMLSGALPGN